MDNATKISIRQVPTKMIHFDGITVSVGGLLRLLYALEDTSYGGEHVTLDDDELENALEARGVIATTARGSVIKSKGYEAFLAEVENLNDKH